MPDRCEIPRCRDESEIVYLGRGICTAHWNELNANDAARDALRMTLGIEARTEPTMEEVMSTKKKKVEKSTEPKPEAIETTTGAPEKPVKVAKAEKALKPEKRKREPKVKEEGLVVFAFRLTEAERNLIHRAAGPARASRFVRVISVAAANDDEAAIRTMIKEAREARA